MNDFLSLGEDTIAGLAASILCHYGLSCPNPGLSQADAFLRHAPRNVVLLVLDGMGSALLERHLPPADFLRRHQVGAVSSVFPPTTTAAATALETGLFPSQHGWLGWSVYWPELDKNVALYPNIDDWGQPAAAMNLGEQAMPLRRLTARIREEAGVAAWSVHPGGDVPAGDFPGLCGELKRLCARPGRHFLYAYWSEPDGLAHRHGCGAAEVRDFLERTSGQLSALSRRLCDTLLLVTADHGLIDGDGRCLEDFPALADTLLRPPSIEPRAMNCFVKPTRKGNFLREMERAMEGSYRVLSRREVLESELFGPGPMHPRVPGMLGDYLAVATTALTLFPTRQYRQSMVGVHGGGTEEERLVPLLAITNNG